MARILRRGRLAWAVLGAFMLLSAAGCGGIRRVPVAGTVTLDGQPLNVGWLMFSPNGAKGNTHRINCRSRIKDGHYNLETNGVTRDESGLGVPLGWYKVTFVVLEESTKKHPLPPINVPSKYMNPDTTPLEVEVKDNPDKGAYDFQMTSK